MVLSFQVKVSMGMFKCFRDFFYLLLIAVIIAMARMNSWSWPCVAMAARTDPGELQAVYAMMAATGNIWASSIPDVCHRSGRWHGIECIQDGELFHVTGLSFGSVTDHTTAFPPCAPDSTISPAVANLTHLRRLSYFTCCAANPQPILQELALLNSTLETLRLRNNGHVGAVPPELSALTNLRTLDIRGNSFTGTIPAWLSSLTNLQLLDVSHNEFQGELDPASFSNLTKLVILDASANRLAGALPPSIGELKELKKLDFASNNLSGAIPINLGGIKSLISLNLAGNALCGPLPKSLGGLVDLRSLDVGGNRFKEAIPAWFGNLRSVEGLVLSKAEFRGAIPTSLGTLRSLRALFLDGNGLTGVIPPSLAALDHIYEVDLSGNFLTGPVPFSLRFVSRLGRRLRLQGNVGLCFDELQASHAQGSSTIFRPDAALPLVRICSNFRNQSADVNSSPNSVQRPSPAAGASSWNPALKSSSSCLVTSAFQTAKRIWFFVVFIVAVISRW